MRFCLLAITVIALGLAGCGSSSTTSAASGTGSAPTTASSTTPSTSTPTTTGTSGSATTSASGTAPCRAANLTLRYLGQNGATGKGIIGFALRNIGSRPCHTIGYPGVLFLDGSGNGLTTISTRTTHDFAGTIPVRSLTVVPGADVSFRLGVTHFGANGSNAGCVNAAAIQVIPPNDTATLRTGIGEGGGYFCRTVTVSPLEPGTSALQ